MSRSAPCRPWRSRPDLKHIDRHAQAWSRERNRTCASRPPSGSSSRASGSAACPGSAPCCRAPISASPRATARSARTFVGLEQPPPISANVPGREYTLTRRNAWARSSPGAPIYLSRHRYRPGAGLPAHPDEQGLDITIFVQEPRYTTACAPTSRFWNASGINVSTGASGIDVQVGSLQSLLVGGIEFDTPLGRQRWRGRRSRRQLPAVSQQGGVGARPVHREDPVPGRFRRLGAWAEPGRAGRVPRHQGRGGDQRATSSSTPPTAKIRIPVTIEIEPQRLAPGGSKAQVLRPNDHRGMADLSSVACGHSCRPATC